MNGLIVVLDFLGAGKSPNDVHIGLHSLEALQARFNYETQMVTLKYSKKSIKLAFQHDVGQKSLAMAETGSEYFTSVADFEGSLEESNVIAIFQDILLDGESGYYPA